MMVLLVNGLFLLLLLLLFSFWYTEEVKNTLLRDTVFFSRSVFNFLNLSTCKAKANTQKPVLV